MAGAVQPAGVMPMVEIIKDWSTLKKLIFLKVSGAAGAAWRTVSGAIVSFVTGRVKPLRSVIVDLEPVQSGSGDPSTDNVRPISGRTSANIYHDHSYDAQASPVKTISWQTEAGTVYGGTMDVVSGVLTVYSVLWEKNTAQMNNNIDYPGWRNSGVEQLIGRGINRTFQNQMSNIGSSFNANTAGTADILFLSKTLYGLDQDEWIAMALDVQIIIPLATPRTYQLTPTEVKTLLGDNVVWSDAGDITVTYLE